jgi:hypothetical protein
MLAHQDSLFGRNKLFTWLENGIYIALYFCMRFPCPDDAMSCKLKDVVRLVFLSMSIAAFSRCYAETGLIDSQPGLPVCAGTVTADLGGGPDGCESPWYHGEQVCPQSVMCGEVTSCMAFSEWPDGTCACPEPDYRGDMAIIRPADGARLTMADDADAGTAGLQVKTVNILAVHPSRST